MHFWNALDRDIEIVIPVPKSRRTASILVTAARRLAPSRARKGSCRETLASQADECVHPLHVRI